jgi:nitronate monooxygenase
VGQSTRLPPDAIKDVIAEIRSLTSKPFAMNLWVSMEDEGARTADENGFNRSLATLVADLAALGAPRPTYKPYFPKRFEDQTRVLLDANVPAFSFIFGIPAREILEECRAKRIVTIGSATTPDEAAALSGSRRGCHSASGFEAGGIAVHFSGRPRIRLPARCRSSHRSSTSSMYP